MKGLKFESIAKRSVERAIKKPRAKEPVTLTTRVAIGNAVAAELLIQPPKRYLSMAPKKPPTPTKRIFAMLEYPGSEWDAANEIVGDRIAKADAERGNDCKFYQRMYGDVSKSQMNQ